MMEFIKGKVSICITTYNRPKLKKILLESILKQTYENYEIIITDNSDTFDTKKVVESFHSNKIKYVKNAKNIGMGRNALKAFSFVDGEFMTFAPDDDFWNDNDKLKKQVNFFDKHPDINIQYGSPTLKMGKNKVITHQTLEIEYL